MKRATRTSAEEWSQYKDPKKDLEEADGAGVVGEG